MGTSTSTYVISVHKRELVWGADTYAVPGAVPSAAIS